MRLLFFGDIVGSIGRTALGMALPKLKEKYEADFIIANAENAAHGSDLTEETANQLLKMGVGAMTMGDHAFSRKNSDRIYDWPTVLRPANLPNTLPGQGYRIFETALGRICIINLLGRVFMRRQYDCPFQSLEAILANRSLLDQDVSAIIVDIHGECTAEKAAFSLYFDGQVSAFVGTHTHVQTNDARILEGGSAFITDIGMCGASGHCIGTDKANIIKSFIDQVKYPHEIPERGAAMVSGVCIDTQDKNRSLAIESFTLQLKVI